MHFVKLSKNILDSTIFEEPYHVRLVWISCLLLADKNGNFRCTPQALARRANVTLEEAEDALNRLTSPDPNSTSPEADGRRIEIVSQNEFSITNFKKYKLMKDPDEEREKGAERQRQSRARRKEAGSDSQSHEGADVTRGHTSSQAVTESNAIEIEIENISADADSDQGWLDVDQEPGDYEFPISPDGDEELGMDEFINRLLDRWQENAQEVYGAASTQLFKKRYPDLGNLEQYQRYDEAFQYIYSNLTGEPETFVAFCFEEWKNWNNPKIKHSTKGDLSSKAGIGFPSVKWLVENHERLVTIFTSIPGGYEPVYFQTEVVDA